MDHIEIKHTGIQCDSLECGWEDTTVSHDDLPGWLGKPCPSCGSNLLTQQDLDNANEAMAAVALINSLTPEQIDEMNELLKSMGLVPDMPEIDKEGIYAGSIETHKEIKLTNIRKID